MPALDLELRLNLEPRWTWSCTGPGAAAEHGAATEPGVALDLELRPNLELHCLELLLNLELRPNLELHWTWNCD